MPILDFLPQGLTADRIRGCVAVISDTHMPTRCTTLPPILFDVLKGADLLIHCGDVGELWVLDQLSQIAPTVAVHGNDESGDATRHLPYEALPVLHGERIFVWHSHYQDREEERQSRLGEEIIPKLQRTIDRAQQSGARLALFGHWHIPLVYHAHGVTVVNPGAIAPPNELSRQLRQTVALAWLTHTDEPWQIVHIDLADRPQICDVTIAWEAGFSAASSPWQASILHPTLAHYLPEIIARTPPSLLQPLRTLVLSLAHRVWNGELPLLTPEFLMQEAESNRLLDATELTELRHLLRSIIRPS